MTDQAPRDLKAAASEVATTLAGSLKAQPLVVGLLLVNIAFLGVIALAVREERQRDHAQTRYLLEKCFEGKHA